MGGRMRDSIDRQAAIDAVSRGCQELRGVFARCEKNLNELPSAQAMLYGYPVEHLVLIATVLRKENLPPERIAELLMDIGRIVTMVRDEFEDTLRKAVDK